MQRRSSTGARQRLAALAARAIRRVRAPVQSIYGGHDPLYPLAAWEMLKR